MPGGMHASIADSVFSGNNRGLVAEGTTGHASTAVVVRSVISNSTDVGLFTNAVEGPAFLVIGQSLISGNASTFYAANGGAVLSFGDNYVWGNFDNDPFLPVIARK
jgi:hypothetical protein